MFHTFFYEPVYNLLVLFLNIVPMHDIGLSIVLVTCFVKGILLPLNVKAMRGQHILKKLDPRIKELQKKHSHNKQEASMKVMELYKEEKINPFASILVVIIQIPIFIALYLVFFKGMQADSNSIYSFISFPEILHNNAFGFLDVTSKSIFVGLLTSISSYFLAVRQTAGMVSKKPHHELTFQEQFSKSMSVQLKYVLPLVIGFSATVLPAALGIYWITSNVLGVFQDIYIKNLLKKEGL